MQIRIVGLEEVGADIARRLMRAKHNCIACDLDQTRMNRLTEERVTSADSKTEFAQELQRPRAPWMMVPTDVRTPSFCACSRSRQDHTFAGKVLSAMRRKVNGHTESPKTVEAP